MSLALHSCELWHVVILTTAVLNLPFGPWNGSAWFHKVYQAALELIARDSAGAGTLFNFLYARICADRGEAPRGTTAHRACIVQSLTHSELFESKGEKVALRRWFAWMGAWADKDNQWHGLLLVLVFVGVAQGVYKDVASSPLVAGPGAPKPPAKGTGKKRGGGRRGEQ